MIERDKITRSQLLAMKLPNMKQDSKQFVIYGVDRTDEYIEIWFRNGETPDEINVVGLNNDVSLGEPESMSWISLLIAIYLCFPGLPGSNADIAAFVREFPLTIDCTLNYKIGE